MRKIYRILGFLLLAGLCSAPGFAGAGPQRGRRWVGSWSAAPVGWSVRGGQPAARPDSTYRNVVHLSIGGNALRVKLTNEFGDKPLKIGAAHIAISAGGGSGAARPGTDHSLSFGGRSSVTIPAGAMVISDPVEMKVPALSTLDVSVYLPPQDAPQSTCHPKAWATNFLSPGDTAASFTLQGAQKATSWCYVKGIDVRAGAGASSVVAFGNSITDGGQSTLDSNHRWPDFFARRLLANKSTADVGVLNEGIGGNQILGGGPNNPNALARFDRDVLAQTGVKYLIILEGINDLGRLYKLSVSQGAASAQDLIWGLSQMVARAHSRGIKVFGCTITPYGGARRFSPAGERERETVNQWIRTSHVFDGVIDFDRVLRDPAFPHRLLPAYDGGLHLHPSDLGYKAMGAAIPLAWFERPAR